VLEERQPSDDAGGKGKDAPDLRRHPSSATQKDQDERGTRENTARGGIGKHRDPEIRPIRESRKRDGPADQGEDATDHRVEPRDPDRDGRDTAHAVFHRKKMAVWMRGSRNHFITRLQKEKETCHAKWTPTRSGNAPPPALHLAFAERCVKAIPSPHRGTDFRLAPPTTRRPCDLHGEASILQPGRRRNRQVTWPVRFAKR